MKGKKSFWDWIYKQPTPFVDHREVNWPRIAKASAAAFVVAMLAVLAMPSPEQTNSTFHEGGNSDSMSETTQQNEVDPVQLQTDEPRAAHSISGYGFHTATGEAANHSTNGTSSMIVSRQGVEDRNQIPPGVRFAAHVNQSVTVATLAVPIIGTVDQDVEYEGHVAINQGAQLFGDASLDSDSGRIQVSWKTLELSDGSYRQLSAVTLGQDSQPGIAGTMHSDALKNAVGATVTRFVGAFAQGSMQTGVWGANVGGTTNGLRNAVGETAQDQANSMAGDLQKGRKWADLRTSDHMTLILSAPFKFRDPGGL